MAQILTSTTGTVNPVTIGDLGAYDIPHPSVDFVLYDTDPALSPFNLEEIRDSDDLQTALDAGELTMKFDNGQTITNIREAAAAIDTFMVASVMRCGSVAAGSLTGNPKGATVTFLEDFPNTNYEVMASIQTSNSTDKFVVNTYNHTTAGFDFDIGTNSTTNLVKVSYIACRTTDV